MSKIYYNVSIAHDDQVSVNSRPTEAVFREVRSQGILSEDAKNYTMSVIRFSIPTTLIPIFYMGIYRGVLNGPVNTNINLTTLSITLETVELKNNPKFQEFIIWNTEDKTAQVPPTVPISNNDIFQFKEYYALYSYNHLCELINTALKNCYVNNIAPLIFPTTGEAPFITFDSTTGLFTMYLDINIDNKVNVYFNNELHTLFGTSFRTIYKSYDDVNGANSLFVFTNINNTNLFIDGKTQYIKNTQEFNTTGLMTSFTSIVIFSDNLPIVSENLSLQNKIDFKNDGGILRRVSENLYTSNDTAQIISDFSIDLGLSIGNIKNYINYSPTAEYRRLSLMSSSRITDLNVSIFWKDNYDILYPLRIPAHDEATIKLLFEKIN